MSEDDEKSPIHKKRSCHIATPEVFKSDDMVSSTPAPKKLDFSLKLKCKKFRVTNLPVPFMELTFKSSFNKKFGPISSLNYDRKQCSAVLLIDNIDTLKKLESTKPKLRFQNRTISVTEEPEPFMVDDDLLAIPIENQHEDEDLNCVNFGKIELQEASNKGVKVPITEHLPKVIKACDFRHSSKATISELPDDLKVKITARSVLERSDDVSHYSGSDAIGDLSCQIIDPDETEQQEEVNNNNSAHFNKVPKKEQHLLEVEVRDFPPSSKVAVSELPEGFNKEFLLLIFNGGLVETGFCERGQKPASACFCTDSTSAEVQFTSAAAATASSKLAIKYEGVSLKVKQLYESSKVTISKRPENLNAELLKEEDLIIHKVAISGLPESFSADLLLFIVNGKLVERRFCKIGENPAMVCYSTGPTSAVVEFTSAAAATALSKISIKYDGVDLKVQLPVGSIQKEPSDKVVVSGLPDDFKPDFLLFEVNTCLRDSGFCDNNANTKPAISCSGNSLTSAVVKFSSARAATEICFLNCLRYGGVPVSVELEGTANKQLDDAAVKAYKVKQKGFAMFGANDIQNEVDSTVPTVELKSLEGDVVFLKCLLALRKKFDGKNHASARVSLVALLQSFGVTATLDEVARRRKHFRDMLTSQKKNNNFKGHWDVLNVIFENASPDSLDTDKYRIDEVDLEVRNAKGLATTATFIGDGIFNILNSKAMLAIIKVNIELLRNSKNTDSFWKQVSDLMKAQHGYDIPWARCENRFKALQKLYRDEVMRQDRTGAEQKGELPWYWELMDDIEGSRVTSRPLVTASVGSSSSYIVRDIEDADDHDDTSQHLQMNKRKVSQLKKPTTKRDMQANLYAALKDQIDLKNQYYREKLNSRRKNQD